MKSKSVQGRYIITWEEKYPTFIVDLFARATVDFPKIIGNNIGEYMSFIEGIDYVVNFYSKISYEKVKKEHGSYFLKKDRIKKLISKYNVLIKKNKDILNKIKKIDLPSINNRNLGKLWKDISNYLVELAAYFRSTRPEVEIGPIETLRNILLKYYHLTEINKKLTILAMPQKLGLIERERRDWLKILKSKKDRQGRKTLFEKHLELYPSFYINIYNTEKIFELMEKRFLQNKKHLNELEKDIKENDNSLKKLPKQQNEIIRKCKNNKNLIIFSKMLRDFAWYRFETKNIWAGAEIRFISVLKEICRRFNVNLFDIFNLYILEDISGLIKNKQGLNKKDLEKRKKCMAIIVKKRKYEKITGKKANNLLKRIKRNIVIEKEIKGMVAYPGKVKGKVKIVFPVSMEKAIKSFNKGDILVTTNTQPSMVPLMVKAGAIVNDIGGITSHAAIVSREFKIPCIVGTKTATKTLKDGDLIEVDAFNGLVKILT